MKIQNDKFVFGIINGGVNIFQEIRKFRGTSSTVSSRIDDEVGADDIAKHFVDIYGFVPHFVLLCTLVPLVKVARIVKMKN